MPRSRKLNDYSYSGKNGNSYSGNIKSDDGTDGTVEFGQCNNSDNGDFVNTKLYSQLRPLLICMRIFGLFFCRSVGKNGHQHTEIVVVWCCVISLLLVCNVIRSFSVYRIADEFDSVLVQKVMFTIWSTECAFKALLLMFNCLSKNGFVRFFRKWDATCGNIKLDKLGIVMMKNFIVVAFLFIVFNSFVFTTLLIYYEDFQKIYLEVIWKDAKDNANTFVFKLIMAFLAILNSSSSMFPVSLFVVLSFAVGKRLQKYTKELVHAIEDGSFHDDIEEYRLRHQNLCILVDILDHIFSPMLAAVYMANIPMFCLVLYTMITTLEYHIYLVLVNVFWMCFILLQMTLVSITAAWINVKAHAPLEHIYSIRFTNTSNAVQLQMYVFLNRLTGTQVGLSALKLFIVDKPTILTVYLFLNRLTETSIGLSAMKLFVVDKQTMLTIPDKLLHRCFEEINKHSVMWSYDYLKRRYVTLWTLIYFIPMIGLIYLFGIVCRQASVQSRYYYSDDNFPAVFTVFVGSVIYGPILIVGTILAIVLLPICCRRKNRDLKVQRDLWAKFGPEFIDNRALVLFTRRDKLPLVSLIWFVGV